jgi:hypothetical protein
MLTSWRCLDKAIEMEAYLSDSLSGADCERFIAVAQGWRWVAGLALARELSVPS